MKIKNRNTNFKQRLAKKIALLVGVVVGASGLIAGAIAVMTNLRTYAANLGVEVDGWQNVPATDIQFRLSRMTLMASDNITLTGETYNGNACFVRLSNTNHQYMGQDWSDEADFLAIRKECITKNDNYKNYKATFRWENAAVDKNGTEYDVELVVDNFDITPVVSSAEFPEDYVIIATQWTADNSTEPHLFHSGYSGITKYDAVFRVYPQNSTTPLTGKTTMLSFSDFDNMSDDGTGNPYSDCNMLTDAEGITLISGVSGNIHLANSTIDNTPHVIVCNTAYGNNTRIVGTEQAFDTPDTGFAISVDLGTLKYRWTGQGVATGIDFIGFFKVTTSKSGANASKGSITATDNEVFWRENKSITMTPTTGYKVSRVTVDGTPVSFTPGSNGVVTYTFSDVKANHTIDVQFEARSDYTVTANYYLEGTTTKVENYGPVVQQNMTYGQNYTTSPAPDSVVNPAKYELVATPTNATGTVGGNVEVNYYYRLKKYTLTTHYYLEGTTTEVENYGPLTDNTKTYGDSYNTSPAPDSAVNPLKYELVSAPSNANGTIYGNTEVIYYYRTIKYTVTTRHLLEGTETKVADPVTDNTKIYGDSYRTSPANVAPNYVLVTTPDNANGTVYGDVTVTYYYRKGEGTVTVFYCEEGQDCTDPDPDPEVCAETGEKCEPVAETVVEVCHTGDMIPISAKDIEHYYLTSSPAFDEAECDVDPDDPDDPIIYYYHKNGTIEVQFCDQATGNCNLAPAETDEGKDGDESDICHAKTISGYTLIDKDATYDCTFKPDENVIKIMYKKNKNPSTLDHNQIGNLVAAISLGSILAGGVIYFIKRRR